MDLNEAVKLYLESNEAQHGDEELAEWEAVVWWDIFQRLGARY